MPKSLRTQEEEFRRFDMLGTAVARTVSELLGVDASGATLASRFPNGMKRIHVGLKIEGVGAIDLELEGNEVAGHISPRQTSLDPQLGMIAAPADRVKRAKDILSQGQIDPKGCSGLVCKVLNIPWETANDLMGSPTVSVGSNGAYQAQPGDVVGWVKTTGSGHVAIYVGEPGMTFIDVREPGATPRSLNSYGPPEVYKSSRF